MVQSETKRMNPDSSDTYRLQLYQSIMITRIQKTVIVYIKMCIDGRTFFAKNPRNSLFIFVLTCNCTHLLRKAKETIDYTNEPLQWATKLTWTFVSFFTERTQSSNSHLTIIWLGPSPLPAMILEWWASDGGKAAILEPLISFGQTTNNNFSPSYYK